MLLPIVVTSAIDHKSAKVLRANREKLVLFGEHSFSTRKLGLHLHPFCREDRTAPAEHPFAIALGSKSTEHAPRDAVQRGVRELVVGPELGAEHGHGHGWQSCCHVTFYGAEQAMLCPSFQA